MENVYTYIKKWVVIVGEVRLSRKKSNAWWNDEMIYAMFEKKKTYLEILKWKYEGK